MISAPGKRRRAITLIELIVVMALIAAVLSLSWLSLSGFFRGRSLQSEARRLLGLTRYAQNQAVSLAEPLELWISAETSSYGITPISGYAEIEMAEVEFQLAEELFFDISESSLNKEGDATILFRPDGMVEGNDIIVVNQRDERLVLTQSDVGMGYIIEEYAE